MLLVTLLHGGHRVAAHAGVEAPIVAHLNSHAVAEAQYLRRVVLLRLHGLLRRTLIGGHDTL